MYNTKKYKYLVTAKDKEGYYIIERVTKTKLKAVECKVKYLEMIEVNKVNITLLGNSEGGCNV